MAQTSMLERLGTPAGTRLLIVNADDFGMCHAENAATILGLENAAFDSATVMVPCPWFEHAAAFARRQPAADIGVHITHTSEWATYRWGPICGAGTVPSLADPSGRFWRSVGEVYEHARHEDIERETRAQIERALAAGIDVTHLDSHMGTVQLHPGYHELYVRLAAEYRLPIRMATRANLPHMGMGHIVDLADQLGVLSPDVLWLNGPDDPASTAAHWSEVLRNLQPGITELFVHAAIDTPELRAITPDWKQRVADFEFFSAPSTAALLAELGIVRTGYRALRARQRGEQTC
jgi:predicted glycoside hydrolase/deacetylase ChbG (UPF0249 family)